MSSLRRMALALTCVLLLAGCTAFPPSPQKSAYEPPSANAFPSASRALEGIEFVTVDADAFGLAPVPESMELVIGWAEQYCERARLTPCTGVAARGVPLCIEYRDCHPALLVPFREGTVAFVSGGIFPAAQIIAVWRPQSDPALAQYGGARKLLEAYLLTVGVFPDPRGLDPENR